MSAHDYVARFQPVSESVILLDGGSVVRIWKEESPDRTLTVAMFALLDLFRVTRDYEDSAQLLRAHDHLRMVRTERRLLAKRGVGA